MLEINGIKFENKHVYIQYKCIFESHRHITDFSDFNYVQSLINNKIVTQEDIDKIKKYIKDKYNMTLIPVYKIKDSMWI